MVNFTDLIKEAERDDDFWVESAKLNFVIDLNRLRQEQDMTYADLARSIERTPAYISKIMAGDTNFTIETMVKLARAVKGELSIEVRQREMDRKTYPEKQFHRSFTYRNGGQEGHFDPDSWNWQLVNEGRADETELIAA